MGIFFKIITYFNVRLQYVDVVNMSLRVLERNLKRIRKNVKKPRFSEIIQLSLIAIQLFTL